MVKIKKKKLFKKKKDTLSFSKDYGLEGVLDGLESDLQTFRATFPLLDASLETVINKQQKDLDQIIKKIKVRRKRKPTFDFLEQVMSVLKNSGYILSGPRLIRESYLIMLSGKFDSFLSNLLKYLFLNRPELLNIETTEDKRTIDYSEIFSFTSIKDIKNSLIEQEIDRALRGSREDQLKFLEKKTNSSLIASIQNWPKVVEINERRNILVHWDGLVSKQYIDVCKKNKCLDPEIKLGKRILVTNDYLYEALDTFLEAGLIILHIIWRKIFPKEIDRADGIFSVALVDLLEKKKYPLAIRLADFGLGKIRFSKEQYKLETLINKAIAYKFSGDDKQCSELIDGEDWSAKNDIFKMAVAVLRDDYKLAAQYMIRMGDRRIRDKEYRSWPLFMKFRSSKEFRRAYKKVFKKEFKPLQEVRDRSAELIKELKEISKREKRDKGRITA